MRMGNPSLRRILNRTNANSISINSEPSTYVGVAKKSLLFGAITILAAIISAALLNMAFVHQDETLLSVVLLGASVCAVPMLIISLVVAFAPSTVKVLGSIYSVLQGGLLGVMVYFVDAFYPGVALAAVLATLIVFVISLVLNKMLEVKIRGGLMRGMLIAFLSFVVLELVLFVASLIVPNLAELFAAYLWLQLAISAFSIVYATIMLLWDLQTADLIVRSGVDKRYEWQVAFSLVTTLVYLYIEILELIVRLMMLFGNRRR